MPRIDPATVPLRTGTTYPPPYDAEARGRSALMLGDAGGLTQFGVNVTILAPGAKSSMRHWHETEDEFVMVLSGACVLVEDAGETPMNAGDCAAFPAGNPDGHHFINQSDGECRLLVVGTRQAHDVATYSDIDLKVTITPEGNRYARKDGTPYPEKGAKE
ncbi:cupin domain-containing protein [Pararhodobacter sp. SW119]|uniref:cupin domain-containing protein n=1 Tax=Pararhodobacter sp. SW119 TaxID=2780075 RepID=UPI001ADF42B7|nr:cupin domain-containing protein [Pararhodobacter sp. SW119]